METEKKKRHGTGERASIRGKMLTHPLENGNPPPDPMVARTASAKNRRKHAHHVNRRFVRNQMKQIKEFLKDAIDDVSDFADFVVATVNSQPSNWMEQKIISTRCTVTVTAGRIIFNE